MKHFSHSDFWLILMQKGDLPRSEDPSKPEATEKVFGLINVLEDKTCMKRRLVCKKFKI
jgi:hypothetical protein